MTVPPQDELFAIYNVADVCLVTSVRDGMNLVSHEYVAAQSEPRHPLTTGALCAYVCVCVRA